MSVKRVFGFVALALSMAFCMSSCGIHANDTADAGFRDIIMVDGKDVLDEPLPDIGHHEDIPEEVDPEQASPSAEGSLGNARAVAAGLRCSVMVQCAFDMYAPYPYTDTYYSNASGVIYELEDDGSAFILTNHHVVYQEGAIGANSISNDISIYLYGMEKAEYAVPATYVGGSINCDIAVLRVEKNDILKKAAAQGSVTSAVFADSDRLALGETALVIGNPSSGGISVTCGVVSVESEYITMEAVDGSGAISYRVIRTDAPINFGNSGGGMFNDRGELMGIVNSKVVKANVDSIGHAIPSNLVRAAADNIIDNCFGTDCLTARRALLGVMVQAVDLESVYDPAAETITRRETISVVDVTSGSIASGVLKNGDIILGLTIGDGTSKDIYRLHHVIDSMLDARVGDTVTMLIRRDGTEMSVSIEITEECLAVY